MPVTGHLQCGNVQWAGPLVGTTGQALHSGALHAHLCTLQVGVELGTPALQTLAGHAATTPVQPGSGFGSSGKEALPCIV